MHDNSVNITYIYINTTFIFINITCIYKNIDCIYRIFKGVYLLTFLIFGVYDMVRLNKFLIFVNVDL